MEHKKILSRKFTNKKYTKTNNNIYDSSDDSDDSDNTDVINNFSGGRWIGATKITTSKKALKQLSRIRINTIFRLILISADEATGKEWSDVRVWDRIRIARNKLEQFNKYIKFYNEQLREDKLNNTAHNITEEMLKSYEDKKIIRILLALSYVYCKSTNVDGEKKNDFILAIKKLYEDKAQRGVNLHKGITDLIKEHFIRDINIGTVVQKTDILRNDKNLVGVLFKYVLSLSLGINRSRAFDTLAAKSMENTVSQYDTIINEDMEKKADRHIKEQEILINNKKGEANVMQLIISTFIALNKIETEYSLTIKDILLNSGTTKTSNANNDANDDTTIIPTCVESKKKIIQYCTTLLANLQSITLKLNKEILINQYRKYFNEFITDYNEIKQQITNKREMHFNNKCYVGEITNELKEQFRAAEAEANNLDTTLSTKRLSAYKLYNAINETYKKSKTKGSAITDVEFENAKKHRLEFMKCIDEIKKSKSKCEMYGDIISRTPIITDTKVKTAIESAKTALTELEKLNEKIKGYVKDIETKFNTTNLKKLKTVTLTPSVAPTSTHVSPTLVKPSPPPSAFGAPSSAVVATTPSLSSASDYDALYRKAESLLNTTVTDNVIKTLNTNTNPYICYLTIMRKRNDTTIKIDKILDSLNVYEKNIPETQYKERLLFDLNTIYIDLLPHETNFNYDNTIVDMVNFLLAQQCIINLQHIESKKNSKQNNPNTLMYKPDGDKNKKYDDKEIYIINKFIKNTVACKNPLFVYADELSDKTFNILCDLVLYYNIQNGKGIVLTTNDKNMFDIYVNHVLNIMMRNIKEKINIYHTDIDTFCDLSVFLNMFCFNNKNDMNDNNIFYRLQFTIMYICKDIYRHGETAYILRKYIVESNTHIIDTANTKTGDIMADRLISIYGILNKYNSNINAITHKNVIDKCIEEIKKFYEEMVGHWYAANKFNQTSKFMSLCIKNVFYYQQIDISGVNNNDMIRHFLISLYTFTTNYTEQDLLMGISLLMYDLYTNYEKYANTSDFTKFTDIYNEEEYTYVREISDTYSNFTKKHKKTTPSLDTLFIETPRILYIIFTYFNKFELRIGNIANIMDTINAIPPSPVAIGGACIVKHKLQQKKRSNTYKNNKIYKNMPNIQRTKKHKYVRNM